MRRHWVRLVEFGALAVVVFLAGLLVGGGVVYALHRQHWLGDEQPRKPAAFSQVPEPRAGELAERFRPWLRFDSRESWRPLNVSHLLAERTHGVGAHRFCTRPPARPGCRAIAGEAEFRRSADRASALGSATYLNLAGTRLGDYRGPGRCAPLLDCGTGPGSAIYYHVTQSNNRFYVDYWWFLRFNHFYRSSPRVSCRTAFARRNGVCDEHEGDWEGVTVVTPPGEDKRLDYVVYAAHRGVFRYAAAQLARHGGTRPDVFVARGSHASYPKPCRSHCFQPIAVQGLLTLPESSFNGGREWERNGDECQPDASGSCLLSLPRTERDPQTWTVWPGQWGAGCSKACSGRPGPDSPRSPGLQPRYQTPWCSTQDGAFTCDGLALGCSDWLGPLVSAVACDPEALAKGLRSPKQRGTGDLELTVKGEKRRSETTPGVVQALGDPLGPGDTVAVTGAGPGVQLILRAQQGPYLVEARFDKVSTNGRKAVARIGKGTKGPTVLLSGREPVERRTLKVAPTPDRPGS